MAQKEGFEPSRRFTQPTPLAGEPLRPLGYFRKTGDIKIWRRERDSNPRYLSVSLVFKTSAINRSAISPSRLNQHEYYMPAGPLCQALFCLSSPSCEKAAAPGFDRPEPGNASALVARLLRCILP